MRESGHATAEKFAELLAAEVVMHSPLLTRAIVGRDAVAKTMAASAQNRDSPGTYVLERKIDDRTTFLRWQGTIEGHEFESLELLTDGPDGKLIERTVAYRPFPALAIFREKQRAATADLLPPDMWDYPAQQSGE
ncbi:MAG: hypothetical protein WDM91_13650 [Rhizomicrobium sp.]